MRDWDMEKQMIEKDNGFIDGAFDLIDGVGAVIGGGSDEIYTEKQI